MKVFIFNITSGGMSEGYKKYLKRIIPKINAHPQISALLVGIPQTLNPTKWGNDFPFAKWFSFKSSFWIDKLSISNFKVRLKEFAPDIVFIPTARIWNMNGLPTVIMIRNMEPLVKGNENPVLEKILNWRRYKEAYKSALKADRVIAVSSFVKDFLIKEWNIEKQKIGLVYHGSDLLEACDLQRPTFVPESWIGKFLFTAGSIRPARGLEDVLYALKYLTKLNELKGIVIAGDVSPRMGGYQKQLLKWINNNNLNSKVFWVGNLNEEELVWCYMKCALFIMTSRVEACPNTALEAMSHGCISISTDNPPMPEIFKEVAIFYPPGKHEILADKIVDVMNAPEEKKNELRKRSLKRAAQFNWDNCVDQTVNQFNKAIKGYRSPK